MPRVTCHYCGLPFSVRRSEPGRPVFCCTGCAVASRLPVDAQGNFPVNAALVSALATGFVYFNQLLFWGLTVLLAGEGREHASIRTAAVSMVAGAGAWVVLAAGLLRSAGGRWPDWLMAAGTLVLGLTGWWFDSLGCMVAANGLLLGWSIRGLLKQKSVRKPDVTI